MTPAEVNESAATVTEDRGVMIPEGPRVRLGKRVNLELRRLCSPTLLFFLFVCIAALKNVRMTGLTRALGLHLRSLPLGRS